MMSPLKQMVALRRGQYNVIIDKHANEQQIQNAIEQKDNHIHSDQQVDQELDSARERKRLWQVVNINKITGVSKDAKKLIFKSCSSMQVLAAQVAADPESIGADPSNGMRSTGNKSRLFKKVVIDQKLHDCIEIEEQDSDSHCSSLRNFQLSGFDQQLDETSHKNHIQDSYPSETNEKEFQSLKREVNNCALQVQSLHEKIQKYQDKMLLQNKIDQNQKQLDNKIPKIEMLKLQKSGQNGEQQDFCNEIKPLSERNNLSNKFDPLQSQEISLRFKGGQYDICENGSQPLISFKSCQNAQQYEENKNHIDENQQNQYQDDEQDWEDYNICNEVDELGCVDQTMKFYDKPFNGKDATKGVSFSKEADQKIQTTKTCINTQ